MTHQAEPPHHNLRDIGDLTATIHELTGAHLHRQSYRAGWRHPNRTGAIIRDHTTRHEPLITQLENAVTDRAGTTTGTGRMTHTVLPHFSTDAHDRLQAIRNGVTDWHTFFNITPASTLRADAIATLLDAITKLVTDGNAATYPFKAATDVIKTTAATVRASLTIDIRGLLGYVNTHTMDLRTIHNLAIDADRWRTWCRILAGWDTPALRPHVPCPSCGDVAGERAGLRVRIDAASGAGGIIEDVAVRAAVCLTCNATWGSNDIPLLAEQLRQTGHVLDEAR